MFPVDEHEEEEGARNAVGDRDIGVADQMMECARKRGKELEEEETNAKPEFGESGSEQLDLKGLLRRGSRMGGKSRRWVRLNHQSLW